MTGLALASKKVKRVIQESSDEDGDDDVPLASTLDVASAASTSVDAPNERSQGKTHKTEDSDDDDDVPMASLANGHKTDSSAQDANGISDVPDPDTMALDPADREAAVSLAGFAANGNAAPIATPAKPNRRASTSDSNAQASSSKPSKKRKEKEMTSNGKTNGKTNKKSKGKAKKEESDEDEMPSSSAAPPPKKARKSKKKEDSEDADEKALIAAQEEDDETHEWWLTQGEGDGEIKWETLEHNGILFPPEYVPHGVKMLYDGQPVDLPPEAEEVAGFFGALIESDHAENRTFVDNFFADFQEVLKDHPPTNGIDIQEFDRCDFRPMFEHFEREKEARKSMTKDQKAKVKADKEALEEPYKFCLLNGRKEKVGNFRVEPPGLFRGRGQHPKTGKLKKRLQAEQITLNIGKDAKVPEPPAGHSWAKVEHDNTVTWLATWRENINDAFKYVFLAAGSSLKGQSDHKKFEKARELKNHIDRIRTDYRAELKAKEMVIRQRATCMYLIDIFALRAGNEKGDDEADTVGCCSLRYEHITLQPPNIVIFDFLGKDSIRFVQEARVDEQVFKNLVIFKKDPKTDGDLLFDRMSTLTLNKHLRTYMNGLSAKVFRTYNASSTFERELEKTPADVSVPDKLLAYNRANRQVAILCNHQRSVSKTHSAAMEKLADKLRAVKFQRYRARVALANLQSESGSAKKKKGKVKVEAVDKVEESDLDDDWMDKHEVELLEKEKAKARLKFEKDNTKLVAEGEKPQADAILQKRLDHLDSEHKDAAEERKSGVISSRLTEEKLLASIAKLTERIEAQRMQALDREEGKEVSLTTSKINYIDPRLSVVWARKHNVPIEKLFSKTLRDKFPWAMAVEDDFKF
ncbi:hypothetical protein E5Q_03683 [Mixia osmundae IAM 14324]|uniref:DNA topoisomerase I n=1 Tax=Mixia osmundae (strain CBS 9802 / IAM 14324 / JCM 22182 / KY 12970) TaxID=764103 RepID=G7E2E9_MIXOS|nr:hypothetical protein E5Q_03683 [Mixia osmundae IAM 14324]